MLSVLDPRGLTLMPAISSTSMQASLNQRQSNTTYLDGCINDSENHVGSIHLGSRNLPPGLLVAMLVQRVGGG